MSYTPDCADCPTPADCKAKNDCQVMRQIRHPKELEPRVRPYSDRVMDGTNKNGRDRGKGT